MAFLFTPNFQREDADGTPLVGATLALYRAGTTTKIAIYQDSQTTTPHTNPVVADSAGAFPAVFLSTVQNYKYVLKTSAGVTVSTVDQIPVNSADVETITAAAVAGATEGAEAAASDADASAAAAEAARDAAVAAASLAQGISRPKGRLTLASGQPVTAANFTAATHVYYAPFEGSAIPIWDGASFKMELFTQLDLALDGDSGHTAYHQGGKNFDLFVFDVSGTLWLGTGPAWTSDTVRAAAIELKEGLWVNSASMQARFANGPTSYATIAANKATMVGTMRASANGQVEFTPNPAAAAGGSNNKLLLANIYNRHPVLATCRDSTTVWATTNQTVHQANDSANNRISFVLPLATDAIQAEHFNTVVMTANPSQQRGVYLGVGLDTTTSVSGDQALAANNTTELTATALRAEFNGTPGAGFHYVQALEAAFDAGSVSMNGAPYQGLRACVWS